MTNTDSIQKLSSIETAMQKLIEQSRAGNDITFILELISDKFTELLPDVLLTLTLQDINYAENKGHFLSDSEKASLTARSITLEELLLAKK